MLSLGAALSAGRDAARDDAAGVAVAAVEVAAVDQTLLNWGLNVYQKINAALKVPSSSLYAETAHLNGSRSGGDSGFAYVWPAATQFRVLNALVRLDPAAYTTALRSYANELHTRHWKTTGTGGYRSGVSGGADLFYDDNGHLVVALAEAYQLTREPVYLTRAIQTCNFVMSGEDTAGGGGIYFRVGDASSKDAISTLQAARGGLLLYQITGQARYLADATRLYDWAETHIQQPDGLFRERFKLTGTNAGQSEGFTLINSAGIGLSTNLLLYDTTGDAAHLREAQRIARASIPRYFNSSTGAINDEGFWAFELVTALGDLSLHDRNATWINAVKRALNWLHANREDANGHYGTLWGRGGAQTTPLASWHLNDQAPVALSYLYTAANAGMWDGADVAGRHVFYNRSAFDGNDAAAGAADDDAIATDKSALLPGAAASFANVISYTRGVNGVMIDVAGVPAGVTFAPTAADFFIRTGSSASANIWAAASRPQSVTVRPGAGAGGSHRVTLLWPDNALQRSWVQVTVAASARTGLALPDVFFFGHLAGDTGDSAATFRVNALDLAAVKQGLNTASPVTGRLDFNRDGRVNALDLAAVRANLNRTLASVSPVLQGDQAGPAGLFSEEPVRNSDVVD